MIKVTEEGWVCFPRMKFKLSNQTMNKLVGCLRCPDSVVKVPIIKMCVKILEFVNDRNYGTKLELSATVIGKVMLTYKDDTTLSAVMCGDGSDSVLFIIATREDNSIIAIGVGGDASGFGSFRNEILNSLSELVLNNNEYSVECDYSGT